MVVRFDLLPPLSLFSVAEVLAEGAAKYGDINWRGLEDPDDHINHALQHLHAHLSGDRTEGHLSHAATRLLFALELYLYQEELLSDD